jgi:hypothetical protein
MSKQVDELPQLLQIRTLQYRKIVVCLHISIKEDVTEGHHINLKVA